MLEKLGIKSRWDIAPAVFSVLLYLNFIVMLMLFFTATGALLLYAAPSMLTAGLLIVGIITHLITRHRACKLWRRLLLGGIGANFLMIIFFVLVVFMMISAWGDIQSIN